MLHTQTFLDKDVSVVGSSVPKTKSLSPLIWTRDGIVALIVTVPVDVAPRVP